MFTHPTFKAAISHVKKTKGQARWDAGNGWTGVAHYCPRRRRVVQASISPNGVRVPC
jgi:hypothetical protein